jgi:hypothetical protein
MPSCSAGGIAGSTLVAVTAGPGVGWFVTGGTTPIVGVAFPDVRSSGPVRLPAAQPADRNVTSARSAVNPSPPSTRPVTQTRTYRAVAASPKVNSVLPSTVPDPAVA